MTPSILQAETPADLESAVADYLAWFHSAPRTADDTARARDLFLAALELAGARRSRIATALGYTTPRRSTTWRLEA